MRVELFAVCLFSALLGCESKGQNGANPTVVVKISVLSNGDIFEDGQKVTIDQLATSLQKAKAASGKVWYYREAAGQEPPAVAMQVMKIVVDNGLPISLSTKPDFSDYVDEKGQTHQR
jgi:hypothetical protein